MSDAHSTTDDLANITLARTVLEDWRTEYTNTGPTNHLQTHPDAYPRSGRRTNADPTTYNTWTNNRLPFSVSPFTTEPDVGAKLERD